jgi:hypothetical protein
MQRCSITFCETNRLKTLQQVETLKEYRLGVSEAAYLVVLRDSLWFLCRLLAPKSTISLPVDRYEATLTREWHCVHQRSSKTGKQRDRRRCRPSF